MAKYALLPVLAVAIFGAVAFFNHWRPFHPFAQPASSAVNAAEVEPRATPGLGMANCHAYSIFVDPTSSTKDRSNYAPEMGKFLARLHECDSVGVWRIDDRTNGDGSVVPSTELPVRDSNAGVDEDNNFKASYQRAKRAISDGLKGLLQEESPAQTTDVLGLFSRLSAEPDKKNVLVVLTDGLDSSTIENSCITSESIQGLLDRAAARLRRYPSSLAGFSEVFWVLPNRAGKPNCNSLEEQRLFWPTILTAEAAPSKLTIHFDTNPF